MYSRFFVTSLVRESVANSGKLAIQLFDRPGIRGGERIAAEFS